jgi:peptide/nickel transport system permease protein
MTPSDEPVSATSVAQPGIPPPGRIKLEAWKRKLRNNLADLYRSRTGFVGAMMLIFMMAACAFAPWVVKHDPLKMNIIDRLQAPSSEHVLGTDRYGRDMLARTLWGGRRLLVIAVIAVSLGLVMGVPLGLLAGYTGGWIDGLAMRFVDALLAFPGVLLFLLFMTLAQAYKLDGTARDVLLVVALGVAFMPETARLVRGTMLNERAKEYVEAAQVMGNSTTFIVFREILPNCISPLIVHATIYLGVVILAVAALSFLGLGTPPPTPDWGSDLREAADFMEQIPFIAAVPGLAISYTVLAFNLLGDGLRDILDPRLAEP